MSKIAEGTEIKNKITFVKDLEGTRGRHRRAYLKCHCGKVFVSLLDNVRRSKVRSCGCLVYKHGESARSTEYTAWANMKQRCNNPKNPRYRCYGGRGIKVCREWLDYSTFLQDVGRKPSPELSIDRINNDGDYEPGNVRWATTQQQMLTRVWSRQ